ncbi:MAG: thioesterase domain-containing protein [Gammaproteobacteria bacterium]
MIAAKSTRPFYGIQARGWMTEDEPISGIETMAAHYISLITSIQPEGPYDFGGFSLGGLIAYEVTRQLQLIDQVVNTIIMVDTLDPKGLEEVDTQSKKTLMLQAANLFLLSTVAMKPALMKNVGITQGDVSFSLDDKHFLKQLVACAKRKGLKLSEEKLTSLIKKISEVQFAYQISQYNLQPLPKPDQAHCYYIRNKEGIFLGDLQPYFTGPEDNIPVKVEHYWETWQQMISHFQLVDIHASSHMSLLLDPSNNNAIACFCEQVYSGSIFEIPKAQERLEANPLSVAAL